MFLLVLVATLAACDDSGGDGGGNGGGGATEQPDGQDDGTAPGGPIVFNGEGNNLNAYATEEPFEEQQIFTNAEDDPENGLDINAQICFFPDGAPGPGDGEVWFIAGEDTGQPDPPPGWGIFRLAGDTVGDLSAEQVGKLTPTYQAIEGNPENYGCGLLSDGRVLTTDIGNQATGPETGQLIVWFPPFDSREVSYCKIDTAIGTAGQILVDDQDRVYVPSARGSTLGVLRYSGPFPTSADASGGCGQTDATGAPLADSVSRETFLGAGADDLATPNAIVAKPGGGFFVSSVINGVINEYDADGGFVQPVLRPPAGEELGEETFSTGTPLGLGVDSDGTLYYADIGITVSADGIGPGPEGTLRRIRFDTDGAPLPPEVIDDGLAFPDGIGVLE